MSPAGDVVILLHATSHAMRAEKILVTAGIACRIVPVPRYLSSDCGVCVRIAKVDEPRALDALKSNGLEIEQCHDV